MQWFNDVHSSDISDKCEDIIKLLSNNHGCQVSWSFEYVSISKHSFIQNLYVVLDNGNSGSWTGRDACSSCCVDRISGTAFSYSLLWGWVCIRLFFLITITYKTKVELWCLTILFTVVTFQEKFKIILWYSYQLCDLPVILCFRLYFCSVYKVSDERQV